MITGARSWPSFSGGFMWMEVLLLGLGFGCEEEPQAAYATQTSWEEGRQ